MFFINKSFNKDDIIEYNFNKVIHNFDLSYINNSGIFPFPRNVLDICKIWLKGCPLLLDENEVYEFILMSVDRKLYDIFLFILNKCNLHDNLCESLYKWIEKLDRPNLDKYNLLSRSIYLVEDLDSFIKNLNKFYVVNKGPQP